MTARPTIREENLHSTAFPKGATGLDSWANVHLRHVVVQDGGPHLSETIVLANGSRAPCRLFAGPKGTPAAEIHKTAGENIDLFPMAWLVERLCEVVWGDRAFIRSPSGTCFHLAFWGGGYPT